MGALANIHWRDFIRTMRTFGFVEERQRGDHHVLVKPGVARPIVVPEDNPLPEFLVRTNLRTAGIGRDEFLKALAR